MRPAYHEGVKEIVRLEWGANLPRLPHPDAERPGQAAGRTRMEDLLKHSTLYQEFLAERDEILKHKWIESEKAGYDIGFERAMTDWLVNHSAGWRRWRRTLRENASEEARRVAGN
jgi:hypothetical protein